MTDPRRNHQQFSASLGADGEKTNPPPFAVVQRYPDSHLDRPTPSRNESRPKPATEIPTSKSPSFRMLGVDGPRMLEVVQPEARRFATTATRAEALMANGTGGLPPGSVTPVQSQADADVRHRRAELAHRRYMDPRPARTSDEKNTAPLMLPSEVAMQTAAREAFGRPRTGLANQTPVGASLGTGQASDNAIKNRFACPHYMRGCHLRAPCCNAWVACRRCHDALVPDGHRLDRRTVSKVKCLMCKSPEQPLSTHCAYCRGQFANYACLECRVFDNTPGRSIFHCDSCGVCRLGRPEDYRHCDVCQACIPATSFAQHPCLPEAFAKPCGVCNQPMKESVRACSVLACGHVMHSTCLDHHLTKSYACPTCGKSAGNMGRIWAALDRALERELESISELVEVLCRDCSVRSAAKNHRSFRKCRNPVCGSYNTEILPR